MAQQANLFASVSENGMILDNFATVRSFVFALDKRLVRLHSLDRSVNLLSVKLLILTGPAQRVLTRLNQATLLNHYNHYVISFRDKMLKITIFNSNRLQSVSYAHA